MNRIQSHGIPIVFCGLQQTEVRNALHRKAARKEIDRAELAHALKRIDRDLNLKVLKPPALVWPQVWKTADRLTAKYVLSTQCRTLDVLHVAVALELGIENFGTNDQRQLALAEKAGLNVIKLV